ncbi:MAG: isochorismate synthase [Acidimicrobiales bacterium]
MTQKGWPDPSAFTAVTIALDHVPAFDLFDLMSPTGIVFAGRELALVGSGTAAELALSRGLSDPSALAAVGSWLGRIPHHDRTGTTGRTGSKVMALGTLAFNRTVAGHLVVPELLFVRDGAGCRWATAVGPAGDPDWDPSQAVTEVIAAAMDAKRRPETDDVGTLEPEVLSVTSFPDGDGYRRAVGRALEQIDAGHIVKVVLARTVIVRIDRTPSLRRVLRRLREHEPACTVFSFPSGSGTFLGASPELLVRRRGRAVTAMPLAGTMAVHGNGPPGWTGEAHPLETSRKDHAEHAIVVDAVVAALRAFCEEVALPEGTVLVQLGSLTHLGTRVHGSLGPDNRHVPSVLELVSALHPTPAVGGAPRAEALSLIETLEPVTRGQWAGPAGWIDAAGDGDWFVGIRSATILGREVTMTAGAGIVAGSDPDAELAETTMKFGPVLEACCPGMPAIEKLRAR